MDKTFTVQIGNSDNKLTQKEWSDYVHELSKSLEYIGATIHFAGGSVNWSPWQNYCVVFCIENNITERFATFLNFMEPMKKKYRQDSIAVTEGITELL